jgi:hypothetical protein
MVNTKKGGIWKTLGFIAGYITLMMYLTSIGMEWWLILVTYCLIIGSFIYYHHKKGVDFYKVSIRFVAFYGLFVIIKLFYLPFWLYFVGMFILILTFMGLINKHTITNPIKTYKYLKTKLDLFLVENQISTARKIIKDDEQYNNYLSYNRLLHWQKIYNAMIKKYEIEGFKYDINKRKV